MLQHFSVDPNVVRSLTPMDPLRTGTARAGWTGTSALLCVWWMVLCPPSLSLAGYVLLPGRLFINCFGPGLGFVSVPGVRHTWLKTLPKKNLAKIRSIISVCVSKRCLFKQNLLNLTRWLAISKNKKKTRWLNTQVFSRATHAFSEAQLCLCAFFFWVITWSRYLVPPHTHIQKKKKYHQWPMKRP